MGDSGARFVAVLVLLLVGVVLGVAAPASDLLVAAQLIIVALALLVALEVSGLGLLHRRLITGITVALVVVGVIGQVGGSTDLAYGVTNLIGIALALGAPILIVLGLRRSTDRITIQTVAGVLSIYLLIGLLFSAIYGLIDAATSGPIFDGVDSAETSDRLYFSYITLATVGFGDLVPASRPVRAAAVAEAMIGQIYLVSIVALVVSNFGRQRRT